MSTTNISLRPCRCRYQQEKDWGYETMEWRGGWVSIAAGVNLGDAAVAAARCKRGVLVRCLGCGAELLRQMEPKAERKDSGE